MHNDPFPHDHIPPRPTSARPPGVPSRRVVGALVAGALAGGLLLGASLAPAPPSSLASSSTVLARLLSLLAAGGDGSRPADRQAAASGAAGGDSGPSGNATPSPARGARSATASPSTGAGAGGANEGSSNGEGAAPDEAEKASGGHKPVRLLPISHVWLVVLNGQGFAQADAAPASYPYLTGQLLKAGTLLERYSAIEAYELAGDAALLTGGVGESLSTIAQPCASASAAEGTTGVPSPTAAPGVAAAGGCPSGTGGGQSEADAFLQRAVAPILSSNAYGERGLIVVAFGRAAGETDPPALTATTLAAAPPTGALLLSPTLKAGGHSAEAFDSIAPRQSLEAIFAAS